MAIFRDRRKPFGGSAGLRVLLLTFVCLGCEESGPQTVSVRTPQPKSVPPPRKEKKLDDLPPAETFDDLVMGPRELTKQELKERIAEYSEELQDGEGEKRSSPEPGRFYSYDKVDISEEFGEISTTGVPVPGGNGTRECEDSKRRLSAAQKEVRRRRAGEEKRGEAIAFSSPEVKEAALRVTATFRRMKIDCK